MSAVWRQREWTDADALRVMGHRPISRNLNRRRSVIWQGIWRRLTGVGQ